jgi:hypothetical protein
VVTISIVVLPEGLPAEIFTGLSVHVEVNTDAGGAQLKSTSAGKVELVGAVVKVSATFTGVPAVA